MGPGIPIAEIEKLNPDINLSKLVGGENLVLPAGFYTKREKEVLSVRALVTSSPPYFPTFAGSLGDIYVLMTA